MHAPGYGSKVSNLIFLFSFFLACLKPPKRTVFVFDFVFFLGGGGIEYMQARRRTMHSPN